MKPEQIKPLNDDVLLKLLPSHEATNSTIFFKENPSADAIQNFVVIAVGPDVKYVEVGNHVLAPWKRITPPFAVEGSSKDYGITSEKEIFAIVGE